MKLRDIKMALSQRYTYWAGQSILLLSSVMFTGGAYADDWDETTNKNMTDVVNNAKDTASALKDALITFTQVAGIIIFFVCAIKVFRAKVKHHDETGISKYIVGAIVGIVLFFAPIFMSLGKNTLVGNGVF